MPFNKKPGLALSISMMAAGPALAADAVEQTSVQAASIIVMQPQT